MKRNTTAQKALATSILLLLLFSACYEFEWVNQPYTAETFSQFEVEICVYTTQGDEYPYTPYFGIALPETWTVQDSIPFGNEEQGSYFVYSDSLSDEMLSIEWPGPWRKWWVAASTDSVFYNLLDTFLIHPVIFTDSITGTISLDYMLGDNSNGLNWRRSNDHIVGIDLLDTVVVTNTNTWQTGSFYWALDQVSFEGTILFDLDNGTIINNGNEPFNISKHCNIIAPEENPVTFFGLYANSIINIKEGYNPIFENLIFDSGYSDLGGAIYCEQGSAPQFKNVFFSNNEAELWGGAIHFEEDCSPIFTNTYFENNKAADEGGALLFSPGCNAIFNTVEFKENEAGHGGGIYSYSSSIKITEGLFESNSANYSGGGIRLDTSSSIHVQNTTFINNSASTYGGGVSCKGNNQVNLDNVIFQDNSGNNGGGIYLFECSSATIKNIKASNNTATQGGGIYSTKSDIELINGCFDHNNSNKGAIFARENNVVLTNCTFTENTGEFGTSIFCWGAEVHLNNSILAANLSPSIYFYYLFDESTLYVNYTDMHEDLITTNGNGTIHWSEGNIFEDPLFNGTGDHPYQISAASPCIDAGTPDTSGLLLPCWDLLNNQRCWDGDGDGDVVVDMGAYEFGAIAVGLDRPLDQSSRFKVQGWPNPTSSEYSITIALDQPECVSVRVLDVMGNVIIADLDKQLVPGENVVEMNLKELEAGIYFCNVLIGAKTITKKIIKN